jgi:hypothetical protein
MFVMASQAHSVSEVNGLPAFQLMTASDSQAGLVLCSPQLFPHSSLKTVIFSNKTSQFLGIDKLSSTFGDSIKRV